jgi:hypothetical protein
VLPSSALFTVASFPLVLHWRKYAHYRQCFSKTEITVVIVFLFAS